MYKVFLDLDGVLCDFMSACHRWYGIEYDYEKYPYKLGSWDVIPTSETLSTAEFWLGLTEDFWASMPWMPDGKEILSIVESHFDPKDICLLTSPSMNPSCAAGKLRWLQKNLPKYRRQFLIGPSKEFCAGKDKILIDDADRNLHKFDVAGGLTCCVPRKWNEHHCYADRAADVMELDLLSLMGV